MNIKQITPEYLKAEFKKGKSIKDIAAEHYVSPSAISHIVSRYEKAGLLKPLDRCVIPSAHLSSVCCAGHVSHLPAARILSW